MLQVRISQRSCLQDTTRAQGDVQGGATSGVNSDRAGIRRAVHIPDGATPKLLFDRLDGVGQNRLTLG